MSGHNAAAAGQLVLTQPLLWLSGGGTWAFTAFGLAMTAIGLVAAYGLARLFAAPAPALLAGILLVVFPGFGRESASFMTDVPALALEMLCLMTGVLWIRSGRRPLLVASLGLGLVGVSVREFALAAPLAILAASWLRSRPADRGWLLLTSALAAGCGVAIVAATHASAPEVALASTSPIRLLLLGPAMTTLAAVLLPATLIAFGAWKARMRPTTVVAGLCVAGAAVLPPSLAPMLGQTWTSDGLAGASLLSGDRNPVIGPLAWSLTGELAILGAVLATAVVLTWASETMRGVSLSRGSHGRLQECAQADAAPLWLFLAAYLAGLAVSASSSVGLFDRYLYPLVPVATILLVGRAEDIWRPGRIQLLSHLALVWLGVSAAMIATNSFAFDAARWQAGDAAVSRGYDASTVDAGYEWVGYHSSGVPNQTPAAYGLTWWDDDLLPGPPCAVVSSSPLDQPGFVLVPGGPVRLPPVPLGGSRGAALPVRFHGRGMPVAADAVNAEAAPGEWPRVHWGADWCQDATGRAGAR